MTQANSSTINHYQQLTAEERSEIEAYLNTDMSQADIARRLHRSRSTISRKRLSPKCWCKLNSANLSFHKLKHTGFF